MTHTRALFVKTSWLADIASPSLTGILQVIPIRQASVSTRRRGLICATAVAEGSLPR